MYHMEAIDLHKEDRSFAYADVSSLCANNVYNVTNFYIRNLMTGLKKAEAERSQNERDVIRIVEEAIPEINRKLRDKYKQKVRKIRSNKDLSYAEKQKKIAKIKWVQFRMPTAGAWFAGYNLLDAVFRYTKNADYNSHHSHVVQNAIKDCCEAWVSRFGKISSGTGKTGIPGYRKSGGRSTAVFSNLACSIKKGVLSFPYLYMPDAQKKVRAQLDVRRLPHASKDKLIEVRIVPYFGSYQIQIVTDDGIKEEDILPSEEGIIREDGTPEGVMTIDPGLDNFASIADNKGYAPIVVKGGAIKARNQWFNKRMAFLKSEQMKGHDPKKYHPKPTKRMKALSRKRDAFIRDTFYKYAHFICRTAVERGLRYIIMGYNKDQKQGVHMGKKNNQSFVAVPYGKFRTILQSTARRYGIRVLFQEESYTSKACFALRDQIPVYGEKDAEKAQFSGRRVKRGLYRQKDGKVINADINGSTNIGRKCNERIFPESLNNGYLYKTVRSMTMRNVLETSHQYKLAQEKQRSNTKVVPVKRGSGRSVRPLSGQPA